MNKAQLQKYGITDEWLKDPKNWKKIEDAMREIKTEKQTKQISGTIEEVERAVRVYQIMEQTLGELWAYTIPYRMDLEGMKNGNSREVGADARFFRID